MSVSSSARVVVVAPNGEEYSLEEADITTPGLKLDITDGTFKSFAECGFVGDHWDDGTPYVPATEREQEHERRSRATHH